MTRDKNGRFVKKSIAAKAKDLKAKGLTNSQIAQQLGVRPQNVFRALHRADFKVKRVHVTEKVQALRTDENECTNELCREGRSMMCECPCEGTWHGIPMTIGVSLETRLEAADKGIRLMPNGMVFAE